MDRKQLLKPFQDLKKDIETLKKNKSLHGLVDKFHAEKKLLEKKIEKSVHEEIKKAKKFLAEQKKELNIISKKVESMISKKPLKKSTKKVATKKKATTAPKTTKKVSKKSAIK